jgi:L-rhamnono-1,4-lactonase
MAEQTLLVDAHVHLFPSSELDTIAWNHPGHPLYARYSITEYLAATSSPRHLRGFIFVEVDRKHDLDPESGWNFPLLEVAWLSRIALGTPKPGEGHETGHQSLVLGIVPWAPVAAGVGLLAAYVERAREQARGARGLVKGFRYLLQDKPRSVMLEERFVEGLKWLGKEGFRFDLAIDQRSGGTWQLEDAVQMLGMTYEGVPEEEKVVVIIGELATGSDALNPCAVSDGPLDWAPLPP